MEDNTTRRPAKPARPRDVDLVLRGDIALNLAVPRKLPRQDPPRR